MHPTSRRPVARLSTPGEIAAAIPVLCGFLPQGSVVVVSLRGRRKRVGLTARLDLPPPTGEAAVAEALAGRMALDGAARAVVVVFAAERREAFVAALTAALAGEGIDVEEALHVADGRWTSYSCGGSCCPAEGTPVPPVPSLLETERVLSGRAVLASRDDLVATVAAPVLLARAQAQQDVAAAEEAALEEVLTEGRAGFREAAVAAARDALALVAEGGQLHGALVARLAVALHDVHVRDEIASWSLEHEDALLTLALQVARGVAPPDDAPACTLLAWAAYVRGNGALANVALDRALGSDSGYAMARLLRSCLDGGVPPAEVRELTRRAS